MKQLQTEGDLIAVASALAGPKSQLSDTERAMQKGASRRRLDGALLDATRAAILAGGDPLGEAFAVIRSAEERRTDGATYTPSCIVDSMMNWAEAEADPVRIVDPGAGTGRFLLAAATRFPKAKLIAIELDPLAALMLRANVAVLGLGKRTSVIVDDYRQVTLPAIKGQTLFIGNPPYVRHHNIGNDWKTWFADAAADFGVKASKLAGLHIHFFVRTLQLARKGDAGAFITSSEWLDVNYGATLRKLLAKELGGVGLHVLDPTAMPFSDATMTTGAIACFKIGSEPESLRVREVKSLDSLNGLSAGTLISWDEVAKASRWSTIVRPGPGVPAGYIELGELCRVHRGQVTGNNGIWIAGAHTDQLPDAVLKATVTKARDLINAGDVLTDETFLKRVIDLPADLEELDADSLKAVRRFLTWAKKHGADQSYIAQHRRAWWSVGLKAPAPIVCTYMARRAPAFVRNLCGARHINIAHGLYPREALGEGVLDALAAWLRLNVGVESGRTYAGGLTKFEPKEIERLTIPKIENLPI
ncbi:tRNA1(Val) (adenine(37)-N6)-methyltransferase [Paraburkholderia nemoris]|uniref:Eco57I restriction-modification methylase domain-containing protein n=1 Tax=Paraburkholderia nemoris TaxID=2793076 RepID=UPI001909C2F1|nr:MULTISPECIES: N-6 DNA methylase [Paraburkholderia]MBK3787063.1 class I SAM-dependent methyltransferase [Paraburkholderia aspalathi]CAE6866180.1 tRNA1(Val) (adenine(37)-N6)-methyltransferase [Paraburkholderia nemoris]